jgi:biopolymer transport protein ExbB/TolQ
MNCENAQNLVQPYLEGRLATLERNEFVRHVTGCAACEAEVIAYREMFETLREMPRLERGLSVMAALGAIAPLLGLLGTVTGMIRTFNVITVYGTGDPKLMSGGISEALIATKWGLCIAVPTMMLHVFLSRRAASVVSDMEEKAVGLTNVVQKEQRRGNMAVTA